MLKLLWHCFQFAEIYTVLLAWIVIPLGYYVCFDFFGKHLGFIISSPTGGEK